jgi:excisionase family DNA binding protein
MPQYPASVLSVEEAAQTLRCSPQTVRRLLQTGRLGGRKIGREWVVLWSAKTRRTRGAQQESQEPFTVQRISTAVIRQRLREVGALLIEVGNQVAQARRDRGKLFLTWRSAHSLRVTLAMGRTSPTKGWSPQAVGLDIPFWLEERPRWQQVMPFLRRYEHIRTWCAPQLLRIPGVGETVLMELQQLAVALRTLAEMLSPQGLTPKDAERHGPQTDEGGTYER